MTSIPPLTKSSSSNLPVEKEDKIAPGTSLLGTSHTYAMPGAPQDKLISLKVKEEQVGIEYIPPHSEYDFNTAFDKFILKQFPTSVVEKEDKIAPGTSLLGTSHTYAMPGAPQDKPSAKRVDLLKGQKTDRVEVEELELMENVLPVKYEEAREEEKLCRQKEDFSDVVAENDKKRKRKMHDEDKKSKNNEEEE
ncbi:uncharacterized protein [Rutidosis leptorrhynchoides]